jgi:hypothetical protein
LRSSTVRDVPPPAELSPIAQRLETLLSGTLGGWCHRATAGLGPLSPPTSENGHQWARPTYRRPFHLLTVAVARHSTGDQAVMRIRVGCERRRASLVNVRWVRTGGRGPVCGSTDAGEANVSVALQAHKRSATILLRRHTAAGDAPNRVERHTPAAAAPLLPGACRAHTSRTNACALHVWHCAHATASREKTATNTTIARPTGRRTARAARAARAVRVVRVVRVVRAKRGGETVNDPLTFPPGLTCSSCSGGTCGTGRTGGSRGTTQPDSEPFRPYRPARKWYGRK